MKDIILKVDKLKKEYESFSLKDVSFEIEKGKIVGFIGNNGAGKTTTIRCILGLSPYQAGTIQVNGSTIDEDEEKYKSSIGVAFDTGYFYDSFTLKRMKNIVKAGFKNWDDIVFHEYLGKYHLDENKKIESLSKGMRMKYSLALAMSHNAEILIFDEPSSGLDPKSRHALCEEMLEHKKQGKTVFFSTHITSDLDKIADDIVLIDDGRILFGGSKDSFMNQGKETSKDIETVMLDVIGDSSIE